MNILLALALRWLSLHLRRVNCQINDKPQSFLEFPIYFTLLAEYTSEYLFYLPSKLSKFIKYRILQPFPPRQRYIIQKLNKQPCLFDPLIYYF